jgi:hypothetical protein
MAVRKTQKGANLKRWFKEKWTDEKGNPCGSAKRKGVKKCRPSKRVRQLKRGAKCQPLKNVRL